METERLNIHIASENEMRQFISLQENEMLKTAYGEMLDSALKHPDEWEWYAVWMIELKNGAHIGELCFKGLDENGTAEIGYGISEEYQGNGYATEAVKAAAGWALAMPGVKCVLAETETDNAASIRVLEKCGFISTGTSGEEGPLYEKRN